MESLGSRWLDRWLLEEPWVLLCVLAVLVLIFLAQAQWRRDRRWSLLSGLTSALALGVYGLSLWVETPVERVIRQTRELVLATAPPDLDVLRSLLEPQAILLGPHGEVWVEGEGFLSLLENTLRRYPFKSNTPVSIRPAGPSGDQITVELRVRTVMESAALGDAIPTAWQLTWARLDDGQWRVARVQWQMLWNQIPSRGYLAR